MKVVSIQIILTRRSEIKNQKTLTNQLLTCDLSHKLQTKLEPDKKELDNILLSPCNAISGTTVKPVP